MKNEKVFLVGKPIVFSFRDDEEEETDENGHPIKPTNK